MKRILMIVIVVLLIMSFCVSIGYDLGAFFAPVFQNSWEVLP